MWFGCRLLRTRIQGQLATLAIFGTSHVLLMNKKKSLHRCENSWSRHLDKPSHFKELRNFFVLYLKLIQAYFWLQDFYLLKTRKEKTKEKKKQRRILASDCLYLFINFSIELLFKVAHLYFFQLLCILKIKDELKIHCAFCFSFRRLKAEQIFFLIVSA